MASPEDAHREMLGRIVREAWVSWARTQPYPKPSWLAPYDDLDGPDKEADRQIGEAVECHVTAALQRRIERLEAAAKAVVDSSLKYTFGQQDLGYTIDNLANCLAGDDGAAGPRMGEMP